MNSTKNHKKARYKPLGIASHRPSPNINPEKKRRRFLARAIAKADAAIKSLRVFGDLMRRRRQSLYWTNKGNRDGVEAETALLMVILDNLDLRTWQPSKKNLEQMAKQAGLVSPCGSISRATRAAERLTLLGILSAPKAYFNPYDARCECKQITVTEAFFTLLGLDLKAAKRERAKLAGEHPDNYEAVNLNHPAIITATLANREKMNAAGLARMRAKRERARQEKALRYGVTASPA